MSAPIAFGRRCVVPTLGELARRHPRLAVSLELDDRVVDIVGEGLDVAIRIGGLADSSAMMRKLADNRRILVAAPAYLDTAGRPSTPTGGDRPRVPALRDRDRALAPERAKRRHGQPR